MVRKKINKILRFLIRILVTGASKQNFLGQPAIPFILKVTPKSKKFYMVLKILALSPHYFIYKDRAERYPKTMSRIQVLEAEFDRNKQDAEAISDKALSLYLNKDMNVLDYGCGPGWYAKASSKYCNQVHGVDVSCGAIACAKEINNAVNIVYHVLGKEGLSIISPESIDFIYSIAVIQHVTDDIFVSILDNFYKILKPGGKVLCHVALDISLNFSPKVTGKKNVLKKKLKDRYNLLMLYRKKDTVIDQIKNAGFDDVSVVLGKDICDIDVDMAKQHLFIFNK